ncbi:unnamed protein product [Protopolystoma xenopodis]|uniref:Uncharacterized protein n=1 Tax=Protopolystoma xenopodis TaxID=117903 RepID=A0A3S5BMJ4_9PLAT|nr:unnamed protein product [Protopolystoma xenopodis]
MDIALVRSALCNINNDKQRRVTREQSPISFRKENNFSRTSITSDYSPTCNSPAMEPGSKPDRKTKNGGIFESETWTYVPQDSAETLYSKSVSADAQLPTKDKISPNQAKQLNNPKENRNLGSTVYEKDRRPSKGENNEKTKRAQAVAIQLLNNARNDYERLGLHPGATT